MANIKRTEILNLLKHKCFITFNEIHKYKIKLENILSEINYDTELYKVYLEYSKKNDAYFEMLLEETIPFFEKINLDNKEWIFILNLIYTQVALTSHWIKCMNSNYITKTDVSIEEMYKKWLINDIHLYTNILKRYNNIL
jgi:hypothetical protein